MRKLLQISVLFMIISCNKDLSRERELTLKEKELELRERELKMRESDTVKIVDNEEEHPQSLSDLFKRNSKSVFIIYAKGNEAVAQGSGFFIREDGVGVSNFHVFRDAEEAIIRTNDGNKYMISEILNYSQDEDFIVFKITNTESNYFEPLNFANSIPEIGDECFAIGSPRGLEQTLSKGIISGYRNNYIQTTAQITHGSSGGALFDKNGDVIGITTRGVNEADLNFALNVVNFDFFKNLQSKSSEVQQPHNTDYKQVVLAIIQQYFQAGENHDFATLEDMYADRLSRCYNQFNYTREQVMEEHRRYVRTYPHPRSIIDYESIDMNKDYDGSIMIHLNLDFIIKGKNWNSSKTFTYSMFMKLNEDYKITSVFTSII